jgi:hypothetical protein
MVTNVLLQSSVSARINNSKLNAVVVWGENKFLDINLTEE